MFSRLVFRAIGFGFLFLAASAGSAAFAHPTEPLRHGLSDHDHFHCHQNKSCHSHSHDTSHH